MLSDLGFSRMFWPKVGGLLAAGFLFGGIVGLVVQDASAAQMDYPKTFGTSGDTSSNPAASVVVLAPVTQPTAVVRLPATSTAQTVTSAPVVRRQVAAVQAPANTTVPGDLAITSTTANPPATSGCGNSMDPRCPTKSSPEPSSSDPTSNPVAPTTDSITP